MNEDSIKTAFGILLLLIVQVMILNNIHLFGCATPLLLVYAIITLPLNTARWASLLIGFSLGLVSDCFTNTPGVKAASLTLIAFLQPAFLSMFVERDTPENLTASIRSLGFSKFLFFSLTLTLLHCAAVFILEDFSFSHWQQLLLNIGGSTVLSYLFILTMESFRKE